MADLKKCLQYYENYNLPPSANSLLWKKERRTMATIEMKAGKETESVRKGQEASIGLIDPKF